tara:strand:- start:281 stop:457 length:177 start_codon:yes stop_codon:yes gene_type:complete
MDEFEIISDEKFKATVDSFSIQELLEYKKKLLSMIHEIDKIIKKRENKKSEAENFFKN